MSVSATIIVYRDDEEIEVELEGDVERYGSYNPMERGLSVGDWDVISPDGIVLTPDECERALEALNDNIEE